MHCQQTRLQAHAHLRASFAAWSLITCTSRACYSAQLRTSLSKLYEIGLRVQCMHVEGLRHAPRYHRGCYIRMPRYTQLAEARQCTWASGSAVKHADAHLLCSHTNPAACHARGANLAWTAPPSCSELACA